MPATALLFGPYHPPRLRIGQTVIDEARSEIVRVGGITDAPIQWPRRLKTGRPAVIVCGSLVDAIRRESVAAIAHNWGVSATTVWAWRKAFEVPRMTEGTKQLYRELMPDRLPPTKAALGRARADTPEHRAKQSAARKGKPVPPQTRKGLLRAAKKKWTANRRRSRRLAMKAAVRRGDLPAPPAPANPWTARELRLLGTTLDATVAALTGRTIAAVRTKRQQLGIRMSRHSQLHHQKK